MLQHQQPDELQDSTNISESYKQKILLPKDIDFKIQIPKYHETFTNFGKKQLLQRVPPETARDVSLWVARFLKPVILPDSTFTIFSQKIGGLQFHPPRWFGGRV